MSNDGYLLNPITKPIRDPIKPIEIRFIDDFHTSVSPMLLPPLISIAPRHATPCLPGLESATDSELLALSLRTMDHHQVEAAGRTSEKLVDMYSLYSYCDLEVDGVDSSEKLLL